jgi:prepilin-type N-terminal cleavage/methylation domain-containing protein
MKIISTSMNAGRFNRAFTLVEVLVATSIGCVLAGAVLLLLCQTATEQRYGYSDMTVEEKAYTLEANMTSCLRSMSATQGMTPNYSSGYYNAGGTLLGYQSVYIFYPSNGTYVMGNINYNSTNGTVTYISNTLSPNTSSTVWAVSNSVAALTECYFTSSFNPDGSQNNSLVNVQFQMSDNGFSQQPANNNPASLYRNFSVQMRNDN